MCGVCVVIDKKLFATVWVDATICGEKRNRKIKNNPNRIKMNVYVDETTYTSQPGGNDMAPPCDY